MPDTNGLFGLNGKTRLVIGSVTGLGLVGTIIGVAVGNAKEMATMSERISVLEKDRDDKKPLVERFLGLERDVAYNARRLESLEQQKNKP